MEEYHQTTINLPMPKTGQAILDVMDEMVPGSELVFRMKQNRGEQRSLKVGFSSPYPYQHVAILTGNNLDKTELKPEFSYNRIAVGTESWGGELYAIGYGQQAVEDAVNKIAVDLESRLNR